MSEQKWPLQELYEEAKAKNLWFRSNYQGIWFSPDELKAENQCGNFRWGPVNWELRDPRDLLKDIPRIVAEAEKHNAEILRRIGG